MIRFSARRGLFASALASLPFLACGAHAQIVVSANDGKAALIDGVTSVQANPTPDTVSVIDLNVSPPKVLAEIPAPASVVGPPSSVAVAPDESFAIVTAATKLDPANPKNAIPDNKVSVIDLKSSPPKLLTTIEAGAGAAGVAMNPTATLALVANRAEGTVSVFTIANKALTPAGKIQLGDAKSGPSGITFSPDGKMALVTRDGDNKISVLTVDGTKVEYSKRDVHAGLRPYPVDIKGGVAAITNIGIGGGDADTMSLIDVKANPPRVVDTITVGQTPEGMKMSPDGKYVAVTVMNGSNKPKSSPFFNDFGLLKIFSVKNGKLSPVAEAKIGHWCQGVAWSKDSKTLLAQCVVEREIYVLKFNGKKLANAGTLKVAGGPSGIGTAK